MLAAVTPGSAGMVIGVPAFPVFHFGEKVLMYATRSTRLWGVSGSQAGIFVVTNPRVIASNRSWSVGSVPVGVERHLKTASVKSRGLGSIHCAFSPLASPSSPWQPAQYRVYSGFPAAACPVTVPMCASCAGAGVAPPSSSTAPQADTTESHPVCGLIGGLLSEGEVEAEHHAATPDGGPGCRRIDARTIPAQRDGPDRLRHRELTMDGHSGATEHEGINPDAERDRVGVALRLGNRGVALLGHPQQLVAPLDQELRIHDVVGLEQPRIPGRLVGAGPQRGVVGRVGEQGNKLQVPQPQL